MGTARDKDAAGAEFIASERWTREKALAAFKELAPDEDEDLVDAKATRTLIQYQSTWRVWGRWCEETNHPLMPASPKQLRAFVRHLMAEGKSPKTIESYIGGIATVHRYNGYAIDRTLIVEPLKAARRRAGPPRRARELLTEQVRSLLAMLDIEDNRGARDGASLCLLFGAALRGFEIASLDWLRPGPPRWGGKGFISIEPQGLLVTLNSSKSSQTEPVYLPIPDDQMPAARTWVNAWVACAGIAPGEPVLRPIHKSGRIVRARLSAPAITYILRTRMLAHALAQGMPEIEAVLLAQRFSSHSARRGYCTSASNAGIPLSEIRARSRHRDDEVLGRYIASAQGWRRSGLQGVGV
jgi:integrase